MRRVVKVLGFVLAVAATVAAALGGWAYWTVSNPGGDAPLELPGELVGIDSARGQQLLARSMAADHSALAQSFQVQEKGSWCGVASAVSVLNARGASLSQHAFFTDAATGVRPWVAVTFGGMPLEDLAGMLRAHGATASVRHASDFNAASFREALRSNLASPRDWLIVNYDRRVLSEEGAGHISPVSAFAEDEDMVLLLDTAAYKYPFHWIPVERLFEAMNTPDPESGESRGWVEVR